MVAMGDRRRSALETNVARSGVWETTSAALPEVQGKDFLGVVARARGATLGTIEMDVLSWLTARWFEIGKPGDGLVCCTIYELGSDLYGRKPGGKEVRSIREAFANLMQALITIGGYDVHRAEHRKKFVSMVHLVESAVWGVDLDVIIPTREDAAAIGAMKSTETYEVKLAPWLVKQLSGDHVTYLDWRTQRKLGGLAKRLWVYLEAERYKPTGGGVGRTYIMLGEKAYTTLGVHSTREGDKRKQLRYAAERVVAVDERYESIEVERSPLDRQLWRIVATKVTDPERARARAATRALRESWDTEKAD